MQFDKISQQKSDSLEIRQAALGQWQTNCYVLVAPQTSESIVVDPGDQASEVLKLTSGTKVGHIIITHGHFDHTGALEDVKRTTGAPVGIHALDAAVFSITHDLALGNGFVIRLGNIDLKVLHTPGHTPGSICLLAGNQLISGDTLFPGGPGATKTPADLQQLLNSIKETILPLPDNIRIYPGHGEGTVLGKEREAITSFLQRPHDPGLCGDVTWLTS